MSLGIRWRLAAGIVLAFAATLVIIFVTLHFSLERALTSDLDQGLSRDVDRIRAQITLLGSVKKLEDLQRIVDSNSLNPGGELLAIAVVRDPQDNILGRTFELNTEQLALTPEEMQRVLAGDSVSHDVTLGNEEFRVRSSPLTVGDQVVGVVQVGESTKAATRPLDRLQVILAVEAAAGVILALGIGYWLSRGALHPLQQVIAVAAEIEASDLHRRIGARRKPAEVQKLADTFDAMLERLDRAFREQRNFLYDVSHDLRTPLTALRGNIDVLLMDDKLDEGIRRQLQQMSAETGRLIRLTNNLLYMASADVGREAERRPVELDIVCLEVYRQARDLRPDVKMRLGNEDQVTVMGDRDLLKQMILNLVENGVKYTRSGGRVTLSLFKRDGQAAIVVEDTGPGIPAEHLPHIFDRFYRAGNQDKSGTGLGLAIARWIADCHGGTIEVKSKVGRGSVFTVHLPLEESSGSAAPTSAP
ncbi:MAG: hypothetical protein A2V88_10185 [Elusimicrobia bacterium RBG_16_66_12]|nr:MAG: hypothetical protein A2V88_10185 [Elusimicrobia bacterium RBG_16_66_12]